MFSNLVLISFLYFSIIGIGFVIRDRKKFKEMSLGRYLKISAVIMGGLVVGFSFFWALIAFVLISMFRN